MTAVRFFKLLASLALIHVAVLVYGQTGSRSKSYSFNLSGSSNQYSFHIVREVKPPVLSVDPSSIVFEDASSNNAIDAGENVAVRFDVENKGFGPGYNCVAKVSLSGTTSSVTASNVSIPAIEVGKKVSVKIPITAGMDTENGKLTVTVQVDEPNGFGVDPFSVEIATKHFVSPLLKITDYAVTGVTGTLQRKSPFDLQLMLQNVDYGNAQDVDIKVSFPEGIYVLSGNQNQKHTILEAGQTKSLDFSLIANNNYSQPTIPVVVTIKEKYGKYSENKVINLAFNQSLSSSRINIDEKETGPREQIVVATLGSDVDKAPDSGRNNDKTFAVVIANENYQNVSPVDYARNDGVIFRDYCIKTLGLPERNVSLSMDASLGNIRSSISWLKGVSSAYHGEARIIFYYAGHGIPDDDTRSAYLLPVDGDGMDPKSSGLSLDYLYKELAVCQTESTVVFMDACFSGARRDGGMLNSARGVVIAPKDTDPYGNLVVLSAASGEQTAYKFDEQKHGMFTYYLLKRLKESSGNANLGDLSDYVIDEVGKTSIVINRKSQTPTVLTGSAVTTDWRDITL